MLGKVRPENGRECAEVIENRGDNASPVRDVNAQVEGNRVVSRARSVRFCPNVRGNPRSAERLGGVSVAHGAPGGTMIFRGDNGPPFAGQVVRGWPIGLGLGARRMRGRGSARAERKRCRGRNSFHALMVAGLL